MPASSMATWWPCIARRMCATGRSSSRRIENDVTVKRYRQEGPVVWLLPENEDFEPIKVDLKQQAMLIEGVVVGVIRRGKGLGF